MFAPHCIALPQGRPVTLRFASPDVIHGLLITGTNVNTMVVPGYVAQVHTEFTHAGELLMPWKQQSDQLDLAELKSLIKSAVS
jgi:cytochrome c oxidase subunit II